MKFSLCVPTYNEESIIAETVETLLRMLSVLPQDMKWEIVIADNGSTDRTHDIVEEKNAPNVRMLPVAQKGKGLAIRTAANESGVDFFGFIDADLSADPKSVLLMLKKLEAGDCDVVIGSRLIDKTCVNRGMFRTVMSEMFNILRMCILGLKIKDTQCGLKIMNKKGLLIFRKCRENTWFFDMEFLALALKNNLRVLELPVAWEEFRYKGRKAKLSVVRDGFSALVAMFRIRSRLGRRL